MAVWISLLQTGMCSRSHAAQRALLRQRRLCRKREVRVSQGDIFFMTGSWAESDFLWGVQCEREIIDDLAQLVDKTDGRIKNETHRVKLLDAKSASCACVP
ncbi:hypothetical protein cypCar_00036569 [Cyprinus carpio]|nr:hypothetical protein cypCar_00036569 [Cyprinus carpio]